MNSDGQRRMPVLCPAVVYLVRGTTGLAVRVGPSLNRAR